MGSVQSLWGKYWAGAKLQQWVSSSKYTWLPLPKSAWKMLNIFPHETVSYQQIPILLKRKPTTTKTFQSMHTVIPFGLGFAFGSRVPLQN